jgi:hypothetical protein
MNNNKLEQRKVFLETYGWPYVTVARDGIEHFEEGAWV